MTRAAVVWEQDAPLTIEEVELDDLRPDEVKVRLVAAGICQSDMGAVHGHFPFPLPGVLGHEGVGVVAEVGEAVTLAQPGDRVLLSYDFCGWCRWCRGGEPGYCEEKVQRNLVGGRRADGSATIRHEGRDLGAHFFGQSSFAEEAIVGERSLIVLPADVGEDELPPLSALTCGVQAGAGAVLNAMRPKADETVAIAGAGGVGLAAIMATRLERPARVIAIDRVASRLELARELGADEVIDTSEVDLAEALAEVTGGVGADVAIDTTGHIPTLETLIAGLAIRGRCGVVGVPPLGHTAAFDVMPLVMGRSIRGIGAGDAEPQAFLPALVAAVRRGELPVERVQRRYAFEEINEAARDAAEGVTVKPVLMFGGVDDAEAGS